MSALTDNFEFLDQITQRVFFQSKIENVIITI